MPTVSELMSQNISNSIVNYNTWGSLIINVKSYGAVGNGLSDDTEAIQKAINDAVSKGMTEVYFPPGAYKYTTLTNTDGIYFVGDGVTLDGVTTVPLVSVAAQLADIGHNANGAGAVGDGSADDTEALQALFDAAAPGQRVILPEGTYRTTDTLYIRKEIYIDALQALILCDHSATGLHCEKSGNAMGYQTGYKLIMHISVGRINWTDSADAIGIKLIDNFQTSITTQYMYNHGVGILLHGETLGTTYCDFHLGFFSDCYVGMKFTTSTTGYVTENTIYDGHFGSGVINDPNNTYAHVWLYNANFKSMNNNRFIASTFEGFQKYGVVIDNAKSNHCIACRFELPYATYYVDLIGPSDNQGNTFTNCNGLPVGLTNGKIRDAGSYNRITGSEFPVGPFEYSNRCVYFYSNYGAGVAAAFNSGIRVVALGWKVPFAITASTSSLSLDLSGTVNHFTIACVNGVDITSITFSALPPVGTEITIGIVQSSGGNNISGFPSLFFGVNTAAPTNRANGRDVYKVIRGTTLNEIYALCQYKNS